MNKPILDKSLAITRGALPGSRKLMLGGIEVPHTHGLCGHSDADVVLHAICDAVLEGVIQRPVRIFAPGFGAGSVAGYAVMRIDPRIVAPEPARMRTGSSHRR